MKQRICLFILLCLSVSSIAYAEWGSIDPPLFPGGVISLEQAGERVMQDFTGQEVDVYGSYNILKGMYYIFVDKHPLKDWNHEAVLYEIPRKQPGNAVKIDKISTINTPPDDNGYPYKALKNVDNFGNRANDKPVVAKTDFSSGVPEAARRTYAIIIGGGANRLANSEIYWNNMAYMYLTLVNKYGVPSDHIYPMMGAGMNKTCEMRKASGGFTYMPTILDQENNRGNIYEASLSNLDKYLNELDGKVKEDDHLLVVVLNHGGVDAAQNSYITLWGGEKLMADAFAQKLERFCKKNANVNVVLGQSFSGGFLQKLESKGCVAVAACAADESASTAGLYPLSPYGAFVHDWISAFHEESRRGVKKYWADTDKDGHVTMAEAYTYAKSLCVSLTNPAYVSKIKSVGEDLAFTYLPPANLIYIKDDYADKGFEPNPNKICWESPSIWVRNTKDTIQIPENPYVSEDHDVAYVNVWVHNRGKTVLTGGKWVQVNWARCSTIIDRDSWLGKNYDENGDLIGYSVPAKSVANSKKPLYPGDSVLVQLPWNLQVSENEETNRMHYCLFARVLDDPYIGSVVTGPDMFNPNGLNTHAQRNVTLLDRTEASEWCNVYIRNVESIDKNYTLEIVPRGSDDASLFNVADVEVKLLPTIATAIKPYGPHLTGVTPVNPDAGENQPIILRVTSAENQIRNINMRAKAIDKVGIRFVYKSQRTRFAPYKIALIQKDENGNILGGETFIIKTSNLPPLPILIERDSTILRPGNAKVLTTNAGDFKKVVWRNADGDHIGYGESVEVIPRPGNTEFSVTGFSEDGEVSFASISLEDQYGIESLRSANGVGETLGVTLRSYAGDNTQLVISSAIEGNPVLTHQVETGSKSAEISVGHLPAGIYAVSMVNDGEVIDSRKFVKR